ncbi:MAG TPA: hypothetical protein DD490_09180 [Acidobacteria bacterium]|nr:hypothetical protein [Acidobacteriota bacterium]
MRPVRVLISSRNRDLIPRRGGGAVPLVDIRRALQAELEAGTLCGQHILQVWINEAAGGEAGDENVWDVCRQELTDAHVVIAIVNGEAGWQRQAGGVGICHEEIKYTLDQFPAKLYLIRMSFDSDPALGLKSPAEVASEERNRAFSEFLAERKRWQDPAVDDESLQEAVRLAVAKAVSDLAINGSREGRKGRYYFGAPLDWSRLGYQERKTAIEAAVVDHLLGLGELDRLEPDLARQMKTAGLVWHLDGARVLVSIHGVPSSFGIAEARELVGRPFLFDHASPVAAGAAGLTGPLHLIACHKSCTESQIFSFLGHPDVYVVQAPFGFFAADLSSFVQAFFLTGCRDATGTAMALERAFEWIAEADEKAAIVSRARSRQRVLLAVRTEIDAHAAGSP